MVTVRRFGIRWLLAALAMAGLAGSALAASAQWDAAGGPLARRTGPPRWHHPAMPVRGHRLGEPTLDRPLLLAFRHLELTDAQWQRVQAILEVQHLRQG